MSIDRIGQYGGFYQNYRMPDISSVSVEDVKKQELESEKQQAQRQSIDSLQSEYAGQGQYDEQKRPYKMADLGDISLRFQNETYDSIGRDANLDNLDVMDAISDMQKDKLLEQYLYFVNPKADGQVVAQTQDGMVIQK